WCHVAAVADNSGMRLYLNGMLVGTNAYAGAFFGREGLRHVLLGESLSYNQGMDGEMDEVRLWNTARSQQQIREGMDRRLTGSEPGLVGLWNFDDPANPGRDSSPRAHHGRLVGLAATVSERLPVVLHGTIADNSGNRLPEAVVEVRSGHGDV